MRQLIVSLLLLVLLTAAAPILAQDELLPPITPETAPELAELYTLEYHRGPITDLVFVEPFSLVSTSEDNYWLVWDLRTGRLSTPNRNVLGNRISAFDITVDIEEEVMNGLAVERRGEGVLVVATTTNLLTIVTAHAGPINDIALSTDWLYAATASDDQTVALWSTADSQPLMRFEYDEPAVGVAFSGDNTGLLTAAGHAVSAYDIASPETPITVWVLELDTLLEMDVLAEPETDGLYAAVVAADGWAVLRTEDGEPLQSVTVAGDALTGISLAPNLDMVAVTAGDAVQVYAVEDGELLVTLSPDDGALSNVAFSPDSLMLTAAGESGDVHVWSVSTSE